MSEIQVHEIPSSDEQLLELDARHSKDLQVKLLYRKAGREVLIHMIDSKEENDVTFPVPADKAKDAFEHPYPYYGSFLASQAA